MIKTAYPRLDYVSLIEDPLLINFRLSPAKKVILKCISGIPLTQTEEQIFREMAQGNPPLPSPNQRWREIWIIGGRGGGKSILTCSIAILTATAIDFSPYIRTGELITIPIIVPHSQDADQDMAYLEGMLDQSPLLRRELDGDPVMKKIRFSNRRVIEIFTCQKRGKNIRGRTIPLAIMEEAAYMEYEGKVVDHDILRAIRPGLARIPGSLLLVITSPSAKQGMVWETYRRADQFADSILVLKAPTLLLNPDFDPAIIEEERKRDPENARCEYDAEFLEVVESFLPSDLIDSCARDATDHHITLRKYNPNITSYIAVTDVAFRADTWTYCILHKEMGEYTSRIVLDYIQGFTGTKKHPIDIHFATKEIARVCRQYHVYEIYGDHYAADPIRTALRRQGLLYNPIYISPDYKRSMYSNLKILIEQELLSLLDHPPSIAELKSLQIIFSPSGQWQIKSPKGATEDYASILALGSYLLSKEEETFEPGFISLDIS